MAKGMIVLLGGAHLPEVRRAVARRGLCALAVTVPQAMDSLPDDPVIVAREAVNYSRPLDVVRWLAELDERHHFVGLVPVSEFGLLPASLAATRLGLPGQPMRVVSRTRDKLRMRQALARAGVPQPRFAGCKSLAEAEAFLREIDRPLVVKPVWGTGSEAVTRVEDARDLPAALERVGASRSGSALLCEELVEGPEVSLEGCTVGGRFVPLALTDKLTGAGFMEIGHQQPSSHPAALQESVFECAERVLSALGVDNAVTHTEFRLTPEGPMLIETHTRMGGDDIHVLTERTTGVDMADLMVGLAVGERPRPAPRATGRGCAIRYLIAGPGEVAAVRLPEPAPESGIERTAVHVKPGDRVGPIRFSFDRLGHVLAVGDSAEGAARAAEEHLGRVRIEWTEDERRTA